MNIYHKLDQFIKSARFILEYRDFQKQADLNFHVAPGLNYRVNPGAGPQNAQRFYDHVKPGFNPKPTKHKSHSRYSSPPVKSKPKPQRPQDSSGYKEWCKLMDRCQSEQDLQELQQRAPMLLDAFKNDPVMYRKALDFGMRTAVRNFNKYNGTNYSWGDGKLNTGTTPTTPSSSSTPTMTGTSLTGRPRTRRSVTITPTGDISGGAVPSTAASTVPSGRGKSFYMPPEPEEDNDGIFDNARRSYERSKKMYDAFSRTGDLDFKIGASDIASEVYTDVFNAIRRYHGNIDSWEQALELAGIPTDEPLGQQVLNLCKRNALSPTETARQVQEVGKTMGQIVHPYFSTNTQQQPVQQPIQQQPISSIETPEDKQRRLDEEAAFLFGGSEAASPTETPEDKQRRLDEEAAFLFGGSEAASPITEEQPKTKQWLNPNTGQPTVPSPQPAPVQPSTPPAQQQPVQQPVPPQTSMQQKPSRPWQRSEDGKTLTFSGNTPQEQLQSLQAYVDNYSQNILPKMKAKWSSMSDEDKALWKQQFAYTQKYLNDTKKQLLKQVQATQQQSSTSMSGQTRSSSSTFSPNTIPTQSTTTQTTQSIGAQPTTTTPPTFRPRPNAVKPQPQVVPPTPKQPSVGWVGASPKSNLTPNPAPLQPTIQQQPVQQPTPQQVKPRTPSNKPLRFVNPNTGQPDPPQNIQQQAQPTMPTSSPIVPTNNVEPQKPKPAPVQPAATTTTTTTNNNKLTWHNPNMASQPTATSAPQPKPVSDGWVGASVKPKVPTPKPKPKPKPKVPTPVNKSLNPPKPDPVSVGLQNQVSKLHQQVAKPSSGKLPYRPAEGMNPEARPIGFQEANYRGGVYDL